MKKLNKNQSGFSMDFIILLILLLILLALLGWWVWSQNKKDNNSTPQSSTPASSKSDTAKDTKPDTIKYLEIKEWGLKMPLGDDISTAYYTLRPVNANDPAQYVDIFDAGFDKTANSNGVKCLDKDFPLFVIGRVSVADLAKVEGPDASGYKLLAVSNAYQFNGSEAHQANPVCANLTPNGANYTEDKTIMDLLTVKQKAITAAYSKIVKL